MATVYIVTLTMIHLVNVIKSLVLHFNPFQESRNCNYFRFHYFWGDPTKLVILCMDKMTI